MLLHEMRGIIMHVGIQRERVALWFSRLLLIGNAKRCMYRKPAYFSSSAFLLFFHTFCKNGLCQLLTQYFTNLQTWDIFESDFSLFNSRLSSRHLYSLTCLPPLSAIKRVLAGDIIGVIPRLTLVYRHEISRNRVLEALIKRANKTDSNSELRARRTALTARF